MSECSRLSNSAWSVGTGQCPSVFFIHHSSFLIHHFPSPSPWPGTGSGRRQWASRRPPEASERRLEAPASRSSSGSLLEGAEELHPLTHVVETRTGERGLRSKLGRLAEGG